MTNITNTDLVGVSSFSIDKSAVGPGFWLQFERADLSPASLGTLGFGKLLGFFKTLSFLAAVQWFLNRAIHSIFSLKHGTIRGKVIFFLVLITRSKRAVALFSALAAVVAVLRRRGPAATLANILEKLGNDLHSYAQGSHHFKTYS